MRLNEIARQGYEIRFVKDKWMINDLPLTNDDAKTINMRLKDLSGTVNRFDLHSRQQEYLRAAYDVTKSKAAGTFE